MLTRIVTQPLANDTGAEKSALNSVYSLFPLTREIIKKYGRECKEFSKIAIVVLNQVVRPFTTKWHIETQENHLNQNLKQSEFRSDLLELQRELTKYSRMLADIRQKLKT